jgi:hypothetical protein
MDIKKIIREFKKEIKKIYGVLISVYPVFSKDFSAVSSPLLINVRREGIRA